MSTAVESATAMEATTVEAATMPAATEPKPDYRATHIGGAVAAVVGAIRSLTSADACADISRSRMCARADAVVIKAAARSNRSNMRAGFHPAVAQLAPVPTTEPA